MKTLSLIEIENMEHAFGGKLFQKIRDNRAAKKETKQENKLQRINARQAGGGVIGKIGSALGSVFGSKTTTTYSDDPAVMQDRGLQLSFDDQAAIDAQKQKQTTNMIIIAVVIIVIAILVIVMLKKKKKATA